MGDGYRALQHLEQLGRYDLIVSNPPLHSGKHLDLRVLEELVLQSGDWLKRRGQLILVVQRQRPLPEVKGRTPRLLADDGRYRVWAL